MLNPVKAKHENVSSFQAVTTLACNVIMKEKKIIFKTHLICHQECQNPTVILMLQALDSDYRQI